MIAVAAVITAIEVTLLFRRKKHFWTEKFLGMQFQKGNLEFKIRRMQQTYAKYEVTEQVNAHLYGN